MRRRTTAMVGAGWAEILGLNLLCGFFFVVQIVVAVALTAVLKRVPESSRKIEPRLVWLLLIPLFSLVWNFVVFARVSRSLKAHFDSVGRRDVGDCGATVGLAYAICMACSIVPFVLCLTAPTAVVLLIVYLVRTYRWSQEIEASELAAPEMRE